MTRVEGKRVLVTGAAQGIGKAVACELARAGAELVLTDLQSSKLDEVADEIGGRSSRYVLDVTDPDAIAGVRKRVIEDGGPIDVLINNAGVVTGGAFLDVPLDDHAKTYEVNTFGVVAMTHAFLGDLIGRPQSHLVNVASAAAYIGLPWGSVYASSKWAALGFSESIRLELAELGHRHVQVSSICPSFVDTGMFDGVSTPSGTRSLSSEQLGRLILRAIVGNVRCVRTPFLIKISPFLQGVLPGPIFDRVARGFGVYRSMKSWKGHDGSR